MIEFKSKLEDLMHAVELNFEPTPAFGKYRQFLEHAIEHPAKMNTNLLEFLIKSFTKEGDTILDPMAGTYSTCIVAALHNRNAIGVDIEEKFYKWGLEAKERLEKTMTMAPKGRVTILKGDARMLSELLKGHVDAMITSPPYSESLSKRRKGYTIIEQLSYTRQLAGTSDDNIGNLPHGDIDVVITSPPYLKCAEEGAGINRQRPGDARIGYWTAGKQVQHPDAIDNVGKYGDIDAVITRPPYEGSLEGTSRHTSGGIPSRDWGLGRTGTYAVSNKDNIGNMKGETYLEAMLKVYSEIHKVLKPNGLAIVVVKPFIRDKKVVDLPWHTWLLMQKVGFKLEKLYKLRLKAKSFWRLLYEKKFPDVPQINHEYILVCRK